MKKFIILIVLGLLSACDGELNNQIKKTYNDEYGNTLTELKEKVDCSNFQVRIYKTNQNKEVPFIVRETKDGWLYKEGLPAQSYYTVDCKGWEKFSFTHLALEFFVLGEGKTLPKDRAFKYLMQMTTQIKDYANFDEDRDMLISAIHEKFDMTSNCGDEAPLKEKFEIQGCQFNNEPVFVEKAEYSGYQFGHWGRTEARRICSDGVYVNFVLYQTSGCEDCGEGGTSKRNPDLNYTDFNSDVIKNANNNLQMCSDFKASLTNAYRRHRSLAIFKIENGKIEEFNGSLTGI